MHPAKQPNTNIPQQLHQQLHHSSPACSENTTQQNAYVLKERNSEEDPKQSGHAAHE